ncbi:ATP-dependent DNA helicase RecG [Methanophagales archaeon]|nr:ATP-dependent DNA helicase RecG [Methanophagales archaeon]
MNKTLVHRDYTIAGTDIMLSIYRDRLEMTSPGRLPNSVTVEGIKRGQRYARNQTLVYIMKDYGYVEYRGMGINSKIIPGMLKHNGTEPDLIEDENSFKVRLWREKSEKR